MTFDTPQWIHRAAATVQQYGFVRASVRICPQRGQEREAAVDVPAVFFQFLHGVLSAESLRLAQDTGVQFYLDDLGGGRWAFGFAYGPTSEDMIDLWPYTASTLPPWFHRK